MTIKQHGGVFGRNPSFNDVSVETLSIAGTALSSTAAELNILDGVTADATELNYLDGASTSAVVASKAVLADASGNIAFPDGKGIDFSATGDGSGTTSSELFDDYEKGTFTPRVDGLTSTGTGTYTDQNGYYAKIGNVVYIAIQLNWTAHTGTGPEIIRGLPFTAQSIAGPSLAIGYIDHALNANSILLPRVEGGTTAIALRQVATGGGAPGNVTIDTAAILQISGSYLAS